MKAFIIDRYGTNAMVRLGEMPEPELQDDDLLVKIHAASVNPLDLRIRSGKLKLILPYQLPLILGNDLAGVVVKIGAKVRQFKPGDEVYARTDKERIGAFAEFVAIRESAVAKKPEKVTMEEAASLPLVGLTAWQVLNENANIQKKQKILIHAGSGGVGSFAIQLAKHMGATVATTTSTANVAWVKRLGADMVIDYKNEDFRTVLHDYDVVFDTLGGEVLEKSLQVLKPGGKLISVAGPPDQHFAENMKLSWGLKLGLRFLSYQVRRKAKKHQVDYSFFFMRPSGDQLREISSLINLGVIHPVVDKVFPFESTKEALAYVENGRAKGKVIIKMI